MSIPLPTAGGKSGRNTSKCELYDGDDSTAGYCKGWVTATSTCIRRNDEESKKCNGISPP